MSITIHLPSIMQQLTGGKESVQLAANRGQTVASMIASLEQSYPGLAPRLLDGDKVQRFVNIYVNDADIRFAQQLATPVAANAEVVILTAVAGGSRDHGSEHGHDHLNNLSRQ